MSMYLGFKIDRYPYKGVFVTFTEDLKGIYVSAEEGCTTINDTEIQELIDYLTTYLKEKHKEDEYIQTTTTG